MCSVHLILIYFRLNGQLQDWFISYLIVMAEYNSTDLYYREVLLKKEGSKNWLEYYATLVGTRLIFDKRDGSSSLLNPSTNIIEITKKTMCHFGDKKTCYRFPFSIQNGKTKYDFKCETKLQRYKWLFAIRLVIIGKPPEKIPNFIPTENPSSRTKMRSSSALKSKRASDILANENIDMKIRQWNTDLNAELPIINGALLAETKKKHVHDETNTPELNGFAVRPLFPRSKSDLESSRSRKDDSIGARVMHRAESSNLEIETLKNDRKTVKWDLRGVLSYVSKTLHTDHSASNKKKHREANNKNKDMKLETEKNLECSVVENKFAELSDDNFDEHENRPLKSCINPSKKHQRHSSEGNSSISSNESNSSLFHKVSDHLSNNNYFASTGLNNNHQLKENGFRRESFQDKVKDLQLDTTEGNMANVENELFLEKFSKSLEQKTTPLITYNSIDPHKFADKADKEIYLNTSRRSSLVKYRSDGNTSRRSSLVKYRSDGHIETFVEGSDENGIAGVVLSDRFGNRRKSFERKTNVDRVKNMKGNDQRARANSWSSLNLIHSPKPPKPTRRERSAPPLRFSRHTFID